jgi:hypothetical protein
MINRESRIASQICRRLRLIERRKGSSSSVLLADVQEIRDLVDKLELELGEKADATLSFDKVTHGKVLMSSVKVEYEDSDEEWTVEASVCAATGTFCGSLYPWTLQWKDSMEEMEEERESIFAPRITRSSAIRSSFDSNSDWDSGSSASLASNDQQVCRHLDWSHPAVPSKGGQNVASRTVAANEDGRPVPYVAREFCSVKVVDRSGLVLDEYVGFESKRGTVLDTRKPPPSQCFHCSGSHWKFQCSRGMGHLEDLSTWYNTLPTRVIQK